MARVDTHGEGVEGLDPVNAPGRHQLIKGAINGRRRRHPLVSKIVENLVGRQSFGLVPQMLEHPLRMGLAFKLSAIFRLLPPGRAKIKSPDEVIQSYINLGDKAYKTSEKPTRRRFSPMLAFPAARGSTPTVTVGPVAFRPLMW